MKKLLFLILMSLSITAIAEQKNISLGELDWPLDRPAASFNFDGVTAPALDIHANISDLDLLVSSTGNWRQLLVESFELIYLPKNTHVNSWMFTTSPPGGLNQIIQSDFSYGNIHFNQRPGIVVGPKRLMVSLCDAGVTQCDERAFLRDFGSVLVTSASNTSVTSIWDLAKPDVCFVTSGELTEPGSYGRYKRTLQAMAELERGPDAAQELVDAVYAKDRGGRIMHRDTVTEMARDNSCAALLFYHIYKQADTDFPGTLKAFTLGGAPSFLEPAPGNIRGTQWHVKIDPEYPLYTTDIYDWINKYTRIKIQQDNAFHFLQMLDSQTFTDMMPGFWVERP